MKESSESDHKMCMLKNKNNKHNNKPLYPSSERVKQITESTDY